MIRNLLATTALATIVATGAFAQDATAPAAPAAPATEQAAPVAPIATVDGFLATNLIGETVYNGTGDNAENIGDVNDIIIGKDGAVGALIVGVGGFLGIGEKDVAVNFSELDWAEKDGDRWLVVEMTKEQLESQPAFDRSPYDPAVAPVAAVDPAAPVAPSADQTTAQAPAEPVAPADPMAPATTDQTAQAPAEPAAPADPAAPAASTSETAQAPADPAAPVAPSATDTVTTAAIDKSTLTELPSADIRAEDLIGTTVYGTDDANIGEIGDVVLTADGKIDAYIIDVGGFLGVGEKEVAVGSENLVFMADKDGNKYLYTTFTKEQLDAAATYDKGTWAEKRDDQRVIMTQ
jgi:sporulation protein YlmC with PRC-barrel domain